VVSHDAGKFFLGRVGRDERGRAVWLAQPRLLRADDRLRPVGHLQFGEYVGDVITHGLGAEHQPFRDFGVAVALRDEEVGSQHNQP